MNEPFTSSSIQVQVSVYSLDLRFLFRERDQKLD